MITAIKVILLFVVAWLPVEMGIQALHQYQADKKYTALLLIAVGIVVNAFMILYIGFKD